jgi:hypothetical protein
MLADVCIRTVDHADDTCSGELEELYLALHNELLRSGEASVAGIAAAPVNHPIRRRGSWLDFIAVSGAIAQFPLTRRTYSCPV